VLFLHRIYRDLAYIAAAVLAIIGFETALNISLQVYWFGELDQSYRYWLALGFRLAIFYALLISIGAFIGYNLRVLCRPLPAVPPTAPWFAAPLLAALVGFGATTLWVPPLGFLGATGTGAVDPVFGKDISFYLLVLPWYDAVVAIVITALVMTIALWALIGLAFYPSTGRPWHQPAYRLRWSGGRALRVIDADDAESWTESEMVWRSWLRQGLMLATARSNGRAASQKRRIFSWASPPALPLQPTKQRRRPIASIGRAQCFKKCSSKTRRAISPVTASCCSSWKKYYSRSELHFVAGIWWAGVRKPEARLRLARRGQNSVWQRRCSAALNRIAPL
jgi:Uncharacterised protein family (UPF0182)